MRRLLLASLVLAGWCGDALGQGRGEGRAADERVRQAAERSRAAAAVEERLAAERVSAAAALRVTESELSDRAGEVSALAARRVAAEVALRRHEAALAPMLPLMERLALFPAETLLAVPGPPEAALRGLGVLRGMARGLEREAAGLRAEQAALDRQSQALAAALPGLQAAQAQQARQAQALDGQIATARALHQRADEDGAEAQRRVAAEATRAESLRGMLAQLDAGRQRAEGQAREEAARAERLRQDGVAAEARRRQEVLARPAGPGLEPAGSGRALAAPVAGGVVRAWGEATEAGPATGISYRPAPQARVVAPCGGRVRYSGPFRSFGALVILDCGGGWAFVLAGLERLDVEVGRTVLAGEPLGTMPGWDATRAAARPALYVELRHDGVAVNPAPFLSGGARRGS